MRPIRFMMSEKRKFNWLVLGLLTAIMLVWAAKCVIHGAFVSPFGDF